MLPIKLYSHPYGPFPHVIRIALREKGAQQAIDFDLEVADHNYKSPEFLRISPTGKTPLLVVGGVPIFETAVILEYIDELFSPESPLGPRDPQERARHRSWTLFGLELMWDVFNALLAPDEASHNELRASVLTRLARLEAELGDGPFFSGTSAALIDCVYAALFLRQREFATNYGLTLLDGFPKLRRWSHALLARPSTRETLPEDFEASMNGFIRSRGAYLPAVSLAPA